MGRIVAMANLAFRLLVIVTSQKNLYFSDIIVKMSAIIL